MNSAQQMLDFGDSDRRAVHGMLDSLVQLPAVILDKRVRGLCAKPYPLHPKGCPNFGKRETCPPQARLYQDVYDLSAPVYAVVNEFDLGGHVGRMREAHPDWSDRQCRCVLYWQGGARKALKQRIAEALRDPRCAGYRAETCPEAMGVNVTETLRRAGIELEWPPVRTARQVALIGKLNTGISCRREQSETEGT